MSERPLCIYHRDCADGFTAAWVVSQFCPDVELLPADYGDAPPDVTGRAVYIVDFSYPRPVLERMGQAAASILVLDHHKSAREALNGLWAAEAGRARTEGKIPRRAVIFDMERSGAGLAWDCLMLTAGPRPLLVDYVEDRDLWRFRIPRSRDVNAYIGSLDHRLSSWTAVAARLSYDVKGIAAKGAAIRQDHAHTIERLIAATGRRMKIGGHDVPVANIPPMFVSEAGNAMADGEPFAACYFDTPKGRVFSLRSAGFGLDVSVIARDFGGVLRQVGRQGENPGCWHPLSGPGQGRASRPAEDCLAGHLSGLQ